RYARRESYSNMYQAKRMFWNENHTELQVPRVGNVSTQQFRVGHKMLIEECERVLWRHVMFGGERFEIAIDELTDDMSIHRYGTNFTDHGANEGMCNRLKCESELMKRMDKSNVGRAMKAGLARGDYRVFQSYMGLVDKFRELLLLCMHTGGGGVARGTEILETRTTDGKFDNQRRNLYVCHGLVVVIQRYGKTESRARRGSKEIARFLPYRTGQMMLIYCMYIERWLQAVLFRMKRGLSTCGGRVCEAVYGIWN
ncbi:uncharacterized protein V1516DRAFT_682754, partial [Lipomyces oligophaga]|uniref:uncharacterized protein n=1 Tax=Lipomyces oligophaga TaxID=45792 RepID=UPI0034CD7899